MKKFITPYLSGICFLFSGFVSYGQQAPMFTSAEDKEAWIKAHPAEYQQMIENGSQLPATAATQTEAPVTAGNTNTTSVLAESTTAKPSLTDLPGFPKYVNTGDPVGDDARYTAAKEKWFAENKRLVRKFYKQN